MLDPRPWHAPAEPPPALAPEPGRSPTLTAGFAVGFVFTLAVLGTITAVWLVGMIATTVLLVLGTGDLGPVLAFAATGVLLGRGWVGMVQTMRERLRKPDLAEPPALPDAFWALSPGLQRLVRHARSLQIVLSDPGVPLAELDREMFEWLDSMVRLPPPDLHTLAERGIEAPLLREELVNSRWSADRARRHGRAGRRRSRAGGQHRAHALDVLDRFERDVLVAGGDPFRG